ncbi:MAG: hypothetical protein HGA23_10755 [Bacteroidales bacterium]|nr:hypothetical protein [Bacteroidales bacterium]
MDIDWRADACNLVGFQLDLGNGNSRLVSIDTTTAAATAVGPWLTGVEVRGAVVSSHNDHRIAMMAAVMALGGRGEVTITGTEAVNKSFPEFFDVLARLGANLNFLF